MAKGPNAGRLKPGDRISEYVLEERVGQGGFGEVWRAHHHVWEERLVAIKVPANPEHVRTLKREGILQNLVRHPNAVEIIGLDTDSTPPYLAMEYVAGESLRALLKREGRLQPQRTLELATQILGALAVAHGHGIVHRDVKPENVLLTVAGTAKLTDFGLGKLRELNASDLQLSGMLATTDGTVSGTLHYMAPEQRTPGARIDARADVYAFGVMLFELLTGSRPEGREVPSDLLAGLDARFDAIFSKCYCRLENRYGNAAAVLKDLQALDPKALALVSGQSAKVERIARLVTLDGSVAQKLWGNGGIVGSDVGALVRVTGKPISKVHAYIAYANGAWTLSDLSSHGGTWVLPAHVPQGRTPLEVLERVGSQPLQLADGMVICLGDPRRGQSVQLRFDDGVPGEQPNDAVLAEPQLALGPVILGLLGFVGLVLVAVRRPTPLFLVAVAGTALVMGAYLVFGGRRRKRIHVPMRAVDRVPGLPPALPVSVGKAAGVMRRTVALAIDFALCLYLIVATGLPWAPFTWLLYESLLTGVLGATPGKWVLGMRVIDWDGRPIGIFRSSIRALGKLISLVPFCGFGFLLAGFNASKLAFHDFVAETRVVR